MSALLNLPKLRRALLDAIDRDDLYQLDWKVLDDKLTAEFVRIVGNHVVRISKGTYKARKFRIEKSPRQKGEARLALRLAVENKEIFKPERCQRCRRPVLPADLQGHHTDYSKPLEVIWLCVECHSQEHAKKTVVASHTITRNDEPFDGRGRGLRGRAHKKAMARLQREAEKYLAEKRLAAAPPNLGRKPGGD